MSQEVLAGLVGRTVDWLSKVENGRIELDRISVIRLLGDALNVTIGDLLGEESLPGSATDSQHEAVPVLREALLDYHQLSPVLGSTPNKAPTLAVVDRSVTQLWDAYQQSRYNLVIAKLPAVIADAQKLIYESHGDDRVKACRYLALIYQAAAVLLTKLGGADLAWLAAERGFHVAQQTGDHAIVGSLFRSTIHALLSMGRYIEAKGLAAKGADYLQSELGRASPELLSVHGTLFLVGAMAAARDNDRQTVRSFLAQVDESARRLGRNANYLWTAFGPSNVAIHRVATAMDLGDTQIAIQLGPHVDTRGLPVERRVRHAMEISRAYSAWNRTDQALETLLRAELEAPEQVRQHVISHQLVQTWIRRGKGKPSFQLAGLARRVHIVE